MELSILSGDTQYIAYISHGKDGFKMLDVIASRGLPLDRIATTDVWATDTIRGEHPKMVEFKERGDEYIWKKYRIEVEHLCSMRNGEKVTYEKMFYHVPKRKAEKCGGGYKQGAIRGFPDLWNKWCQSDLKRAAKCKYTSLGSTRAASRASLSVSKEKEPGARNSKPSFWRAPPRGALQISWNTSA